MNRTHSEEELLPLVYQEHGDWDVIFNIKNVLNTCDKLCHKISVLNRRLLKVKAENRRLQKVLEGFKSIEIED